jgi:hypothetical protein
MFPTADSICGRDSTRSPNPFDRDTGIIDEFLKKMENHATAEAIRLGKSNHGKLRLIGAAIGIVVVILLALWMAHRPESDLGARCQNRVPQYALTAMR